MRWFDKPRPRIGDVKYSTFFALFPYRIRKETRWLEWITVEYTCKRSMNPFHDYFWKRRFVEKKYEKCT